METAADIVFRKGTLITMAPEAAGREPATAFAVCRNRIGAVGTEAEASRWIGPETLVVDLGGRTVVPGFIESHNHASAYAMNLLQVDCSPGVNGSIAEIREKIREKAATTPPGQWIQGFGYDDTLISDKRHLTREDLDACAPDHPVHIFHISVHYSYVNSKALAIGGVGPETPQPEEGLIHMDEAGVPTGLLKEPGAMNLVRRHIPDYTGEEIRGALESALTTFHAAGITSIHDGGVGYFGHTRQIIEAYQELERTGRLTVRVTLTLTEAVFRVLFETGFRTGFGSDLLKFGSVKTWQDGSIQGLTGALSSPYHAYPEVTGDLLISQEILDDLVARYHLGGCQVAVHANGDRAIESVVTAFERAHRKCPETDRRHMIIHSQLASTDHLRRMKRIGLVPNFFVNHVYYWGDRHEALFLGPERAAHLDPLATALREELPFCLHSDLPVTPVDPLFSIHTAVNRVTRNGRVLGPDERITPVEALKGYTTTAAFVTFAEKERGTLEAGKLADFAILSDDPLHVPEIRIKDIRPLETWLGGKLVWKREGGEKPL